MSREQEAREAAQLSAILSKIDQAEAQLSATVDELTDAHAENARLAALIVEAFDQRDAAQAARQQAEAQRDRALEQLAQARARIVEADRVLFDCRNYVDSNVGPECYTYADEKPCNPCQVRHALGYGEDPWNPGDPKPLLRSE